MKEGRCPGCDIKLKFGEDDLSGKHPIRCPECKTEFPVDDVKFPSNSWRNKPAVAIAIVFAMFAIPTLLVFGLGSDSEEESEPVQVQESVQGTTTKAAETNLMIKNPSRVEVDEHEYEISGEVSSLTSRVAVEGETVELDEEDGAKTFTHKISGLVTGENKIIIVTYDSDGKRSESKSITIVVSAPAYEVVEVIDGDTIKINKDGAVESVRFIGINSPESGECYFQEATNGLKGILGEKDVEIEMDSSQGDLDKYDRLLAYVWVDGLLVNERMVQRGFAKEYTYDGPYKYQDELKAANQDALSRRVGLFGDSCACDKKEERKCSSCKTASIITTNFDCSTSERSITDNSCTTGCVTAPAPAPTPAPSRFTCDCSKTCSKTISSCEEAYYLMNTCGCNNKDGDGDGVPCENLCPGG